MKEYTIIAQVGLPAQGNWRKKSSYIRVSKVVARTRKEAVSLYKPDKYDQSLGYEVFAAHVDAVKIVITIPEWILNAWEYIFD